MNAQIDVTASPSADDAGQQSGDAKCEVTDTHARAATAHAEQVSPAISLAISPSTDENYKSESDGNQSSNQSGTGNAMNACYKCKHRGEVAGSAHSSCQHPSAHPGCILVFGRGMSTVSYSKVRIRADAHGVNSGWFLWPLNFDPVWLDECTLFEAKP